MIGDDIKNYFHGIIILLISYKSTCNVFGETSFLFYIKIIGTKEKYVTSEVK